jgi:hypothetical protein
MRSVCFQGFPGTNFILSGPFLSYEENEVFVNLAPEVVSSRSYVPSEVKFSAFKLTKIPIFLVIKHFYLNIEVLRISTLKSEHG